MRAYRVAGLFFFFLSLSVLIAAPPDAAPNDHAADSFHWSDLKPEVHQANSFSESQQLIKLGPGQPLAYPDYEGTGRLVPIHYLRRSPNAQGAPSERDPVIQESMPAITTPSPNISFDGINNVDGFVPPDTVGAIGPSNYVQMINSRIQVFNRFTGAAQTSANAISSLFSSLSGSLCATTDDGDPVVVYDQLADRWLAAQFANSSSTTGPFYMSIAVSKTPDPTGAWYAYCFQTPSNRFPDYFKFGVWPDGYYMTANQFSGAGSYLGVGVFAFDRTKMLAGDPTAKFIYFNLGTSHFGMLPASVDGPPPPIGTPNYFVEYTGTSQLHVYDFHADFANTNNATFAERAESPITVAAFNSVVSAIPQSGTTRTLDTLADRLMFRLQYRNFSSNEALTVTHTVKGGSSQAAIRYYTLRRNLPGGTYNVRDQATYAPDTLHRWMGSAALNYRGDLAVGYSCSSSTNFPSIRYAARLSNDPTNQLTQGEAILVAGGGSQTGATRWGDYSAMTVDPNDDCTFWYTQEYYATTSSSGWRTRIGSFTLPGCSAAPKGTILGTVSTNGLPVSNAVVRTTSGYIRVTGASGTYSMSVAPGTYDMSAIVTGVGTASVFGVTVVDAGVTIQNFSFGGPTCILGVSKTGAGTGTITSSPSGLDCGATCSSSFASNAVVQLTATASPGSIFTGWSGAASGSASPVSVTMNSNKTVVAHFAGTPNVVADVATLTMEGCSSPNGAIDPAETVTVNFALKNTGAADASNVVATLQATGGVTSPSGAQSYGTLVAGGAAVAKSFSFTATGSCGGALAANFQIQTNASSLGSAIFNFSLGTNLGASVSRTNSTAIKIPATGTGSSSGSASFPYPSTNLVTGLGGTVTKVTVTFISLTHTYLADIDALLVGPGGQTVMLLSDAGTNSSVTELTLTFDDDAAGVVPGSGTIASGTYKPTNYGPTDTLPSPAPTTQGSVLSAFNGVDPNGAWTLYISDDATGDTGTVAFGWALNITTTSNSCCSGVANQPPVINAASISPASPMTTNILVASVTSSNDPDGDPITLAYQWQQSTNNTLFGNIAFTASTLPASATVAGDYYRVTITPNDGHVNGSPFTTASVHIAVDFDNDGLNDDWEIANFGSLAAQTGSGDPDGDGFNNAQEFAAGTNPNSASSLPLITGVQVVGNDVVVSFTTVSGKEYELWRAADIANPIWMVVATNIPGTGGTVQKADTGAASLPDAIYRVQVLP